MHGYKLSALRQCLSTLPVLYCNFLVGIGWGWIAPTVLKLQRADSTLHMTAEQISWIFSINEIGRIVSPFVSPFIVDHVGRRYSLIIVTVMNILIWSSHVFLHNIYLLCVIRLLFGMSNGLLDVVAPIYTVENCVPEVRKFTAGMMAIVFSVGKCVELILATHLTYEMTAATNAALSAGALGALYFCVETPYFSVMKDRDSEARDTLAWLRTDLKPADLADELEKIKTYVRKEKEKKKSVTTLLSSAENVKNLLLVLGMYLLATATGGIAIGTYGTLVFVPTETFASAQLLLLHETLNFTALLITPLVITTVGIRTLLIVSYSLIGVSHLGCSVLFYLRNRHYEIEFYPWLVFGCVASYGVIKSFTNPANFIVSGELLPLSVRAFGGSAAIIVKAATGFCMLKMFLPISDHFGMETNFLLYAFAAMLMPVMVCLFPSKEGDEMMSDRKCNDDVSKI